MGNRFIKYIIDSLLEVIYCHDDVCVICSSEVNEEEYLCHECRNKIRFYKDRFIINKDSVQLECYSAAYYSGVMVELVKKLKYKSDFYSGMLLAEFLVEVINARSIDFDILTFVPMHKKALRKRGFNQSKYLAKIIGETLDKPVVECLLKPTGTKDQIGLSGEERWTNQLNSYKAINTKYIKNKKILLIDDVITTGATTFCCSSELLRGGAERVCILTAAKSKL